MYNVELGDKTKLATIALSAEFPDASFGVLAGTTTGMLVADAVDIAVSVVMCRKIPKRMIKLVSAEGFIVFGFTGTWRVADHHLALDHRLIAAIENLLAEWYLVRKGRSTEMGDPSIDKVCKTGE